MKREFWVNFIVKSAIFITFECLREFEVGKCGIPIFFWFEILYLIEYIGLIPSGYMAWNGDPLNIANLPKVMIITWSCSFIVCFLNSSCIIYGYILYLSPKNDCLV